MAVNESDRPYVHPLYSTLERVPGLSLATTSVDVLLTWGSKYSFWLFPMATSCCAIEFMTSAASRVDIDQVGAVVRPSPRHADVMVVAGTITVKMVPRVKRLWDQMPEPKWCIAMGSCAISGDFYRDIYSVVPGIDTVVPVDVYIPGCPPNPDQMLAALARLREKVTLRRRGGSVEREDRPETAKMIQPEIQRLEDRGDDDSTSRDQLERSRSIGLGGNALRSNDDT